jgi:hypothetical protein
VLSHSRSARRALSAFTALFLIAACVATSFPTVPVARAETGLPFVGVVLNDAENATLVRAAGSSGARAGAATIEVHWNALESAPSVWDDGNLARLNTKIQNATDSGLLPVLIVGWAPSWAAPHPRSPLTAVGRTAFVTFMERLVSTVAMPRNVHHYFMWLEPDYQQSGGDSDRVAYGPDGAALADVFNSATPAIKALDPSAKVMLGPIAHDFFVRSDSLTTAGGAPLNAGGVFHYSFLPSFLGQINAGAVDAIGLNAYPGGFAIGWEMATAGQSVEIGAKIDHVRSMIPGRLGSLPIVLGEVGLWRAGPCVSVSAESGDGGAVLGCPTASPELQAQYIPKYLARAKERGAESTFHFTFDQVEYDGTRGVYASDGSLVQPGYNALRYGAGFFASATNNAGAASQLATVSGGVETYGFTSGGDSVAVAWARGALAPTAMVSAPAGSTAVDKVGQAVAAQSTNNAGRPVFGLTGSPIYITIGAGSTPAPSPSPSPAPSAPLQRTPGAYTLWFSSIYNHSSIG